jgi:hypothetical protein
VDVVGQSFLFSSLLELWAIPIAVDLTVIKDFFLLKRLFRITAPGHDCFTVFRLAAINSFLRVPAFPTDIFEEFMPPPPKAFFRGLDLHNFTIFLSTLPIRYPVFAITRVATPVPPILDFPQRFRGSSVLLTTHHPGTFVSSPIPLDCAFHLAFTSESPFSFTFHFISEFPGLFFVFTPPTCTEISLCFSAARSTLFCKIDGDSSEFPVSAAFILAYLNVSLEPGSLCDYTFEFDPTPIDVFPVHQHAPWAIAPSLSPGILPSIDSSLFNRCAFRAAARSLAAWLSQAAHFLLLCARPRPLPPARLFHALLLLTPFPLDSALLTVAPATRVWALDAGALRAAALASPLDFAEAEAFLAGAVVQTGSRFALAVPPGARASRCVFVRDGVVRVLAQQETLEAAGLLLPFSAIHNSAVEALLCARLFLALCLLRGARPSAEIRRALPPAAAAACAALFGDAVPADFPFALECERLRAWTFVHTVAVALSPRPLNRATFALLPVSARFSFEDAAAVAARVAPITGAPEGFALGLACAAQDPVRAFLTEFFAEEKRLAEIRQTPGALFIGADIHRRQTLFACVKALPPVSLFLFLKRLYGGRPIGRKQFAVIWVPAPGEFAVAPPERAVLVGEFPDAQELARALLADVEAFSESHFVCH